MRTVLVGFFDLSGFQKLFLSYFGYWILTVKKKIKAKIYSLFNFSKNIVIKIIVNITQGVAKSRDKEMAPVFLRLETL